MPRPAAIDSESCADRVDRVPKPTKAVIFAWIRVLETSRKAAAMRGSGVAVGSEFWERSAAGLAKDTVTPTRSTRAQPRAPEERARRLVVLVK